MIDKRKMGGLIADRRYALGLTQQNLADQLNVTDKAVSKWERGLSFPDITILSPLAEALGITEQDLLTGSEEAAEALPPSSGFVAISYLGMATQERRARAAQVLMAVYTISLILGVFVSMVVDLAINQAMTWSPLVLASCLLAWVVIYPIYRAPRRKLFLSCLMLTICIVPFLAAVEHTVPVKGWLLFPALPIAASSLILLWVPVILHTFTRMSKWYILALLCLLSGPFSLYINWISGSEQVFYQSAITLLSDLLGSSTLFVVGWLLHRRQAR